ncbi:ABC transporter substrate-binding protein [Psychromonas sp. Urea-02u-13]|uniref:ABC transporter substrate-binding protein n=1 Tax=Psychromonas sp. Urea-02u-13 TaxID=2058326 RepID=UPI000C321237|nr:ABC transporter substrate-binding protein [Psychromonas sp. Urea-02u-13]PKG38506.1 hypothetical protein CXF74_13505 [Psychromonas sp. Urea-02u-13]
MKNFILIIFIAFNINLSVASEAPALHFALLTPGEAGDAFWSLNEDFAFAVAKDLGFKLTVFHGKSSKKHMLINLQKAADLGVDAVIFSNTEAVAAQFIAKAEALQLPTLLFNADIGTEQSPNISDPQQHFKYWLASLMPDDYQAGYLLAKSLIKQAKLKSLTNEQGIIEVVAINGSIGNGPSTQRLAGLQAAVQEEEGSKIVQVVYAEWEQEKAIYQTKRLNQRYPQAKVFWAASDLMAIGVYLALEEQGLQQGKDYLTGGIDWTTQGLDALEKDIISTSVGGHFMDAGWATIILYDYFKGFTFSDSHLNQSLSQYQYQSQFMVITQSNVKALLEQLNKKNWADINFRHYSKFHNKQLNRYLLNPKLILKIDR